MWPHLKEKTKTKKTKKQIYKEKNNKNINDSDVPAEIGDVLVVKYVESPIFIFTTRTKPSSPGYDLTIRSSGHSPLLAFGSTTSTTSSSLTFGFSWNHFPRTFKLGKKSLRRRLQNWPSNCWIIRHRVDGVLHQWLRWELFSEPSWHSWSWTRSSQSEEPKMG